MELTIFAGPANPSLAEATAARLAVRPGNREVRQFPDGELHVEVQESVRGHDVYLIQPTSPPAERHLLELLLLVDAVNRAGAARVTAVIPYFGYARQDRRASGREAVGARLVAELMEADCCTAWRSSTRTRKPSRGSSASRSSTSAPCRCSSNTFGPTPTRTA